MISVALGVRPYGVRPYHGEARVIKGRKISLPNGKA